MKKFAANVAFLSAMAILCLASGLQAAQPTIEEKRESFNAYGDLIQTITYSNGVTVRTFYYGKTPGPLQKKEYTFPYGLKKVERYEGDGKTLWVSCYVDKDGNYLDETYFKKGVRHTRKQRRDDKGLNVYVYHEDDSNVTKIQQSWRYDKRNGKSNRRTDYMLESVKENDVNGKPVRELHFHEDDKSVAKEISYDKAGNVTTTCVEKDGFVSSRETQSAAGQKQVDTVMPGTVKWSGADFKNLIIDPRWGGEEPGLPAPGVINPNP